MGTNVQVAPHRKLWRYMDFVKFVAMVERRALYFPRVTMFADKFEGWQTQPHIEQMKKAITAFSTGPEQISSALKSNNRLYETMRRQTFINCWHMNDSESAAMWALYGGEDKSIFIQTTYKKLRSQFADGIVVGPVKYVDYETYHSLMINYRQDFFLYKRKSFSHEKELRVVLMDDPAVKKCISLVPDKYGAWIDCDMANLVERIYVSPRAEKWFVDLVKIVAARTFPGTPVKQSALYKAPSFV